MTNPKGHPMADKSDDSVDVEALTEEHILKRDRALHLKNLLENHPLTDEQTTALTDELAETEARVTELDGLLAPPAATEAE